MLSIITHPSAAASYLPFLEEKSAIWFDPYEDDSFYRSVINYF